MSKRTIHQCDRCAQTRESTDLPLDWVIARIESNPNAFNPMDRMWCRECWSYIKSAIPKEVAA